MRSTTQRRGNSTNPSSAHIITSLWVSAGPAPRSSTLLIFPLFDFSTFFWSGGTFASVLVASNVELYVEEFDASGRFTRALDGGGSRILRDDTWWFSGSRDFSPSGRSFTTTAGPSMPAIATTRGFSYRVFLDLHGEIRAAGFGGIGGSGAIAQVFLRLLELNVDFASR